MVGFGVGARAWRALLLSRRLRGSSPFEGLAADLALLVRGLALRPLEVRLEREVRDPRRPVVFVVGAPRSGSTLTAQLAARCFDVGYVSNAVARFWLAPVVGWRRQVRSRALDRSAIQLASRFGRAPGAEAPHEFGYFFRTWMDLESSDQLDPAALDRCRWREIRDTCEALAGWFGSALVLKNLNSVSFQIERFARELPQSRFVHVVRDRQATIASVLRARRAVGGSEESWWSVRPAGFEVWRRLPARDQVELQVDETRRAVDEAFARLPPERCVVLGLEALVARPEAALSELARVLGAEPRPERLPAEGLSPNA